MEQFRTILRLSRPLYWILAGSTYFLGAGIAHYLGHGLISVVFWLGLIAVILAQISMNLLVEVFRPLNEPINPAESIADRRTMHDAALYVSIAGLTALSVIALLLFKDNRLTTPTLFYITLSLLVILINSVPPLRLIDKGYGEVLAAIHLGFLVPSISFLLQTGNYHRLLNFTIVPITFLCLTSILAFDFQTYASDLKYARQTILVRLGWERVVPLHHTLMIVAYVLFAFEPLFGYSFRLLWPAFLTIPFAIFQIYSLQRIASGAKPVWSLINANAIAIFGMTVYFLTLTFWLR